MLKTIVYCDRCGEILQESEQKYITDDGVYQQSSTNAFMKESVNFAHRYNVHVQFGMSEWKSNSSEYGASNGFILCYNCLMDLQKFLMGYERSIVKEENDGN